MQACQQLLAEIINIQFLICIRDRFSILGMMTNNTVLLKKKNHRYARHISVADIKLNEILAGLLYVESPLNLRHILNMN